MGPTSALVIFVPSPSIRYSLNVGLLNVTLPLFSSVIVYTIISPASFKPFELLSVTVAVLVTSRRGFWFKLVFVGSLLSSVSIQNQPPDGSA